MRLVKRERIEALSGGQQVQQRVGVDAYSHPSLCLFVEKGVYIEQV